jgi:hypothetical protein
VAGWRPFIGWGCSLGLAWKFLIAPFLVYITSVLATILANPQALTIPLPEINAGELIPLVLALLGLGGLRSWEKDKGLTK